jgi:hypothetical protein
VYNCEGVGHSSSSVMMCVVVVNVVDIRLPDEFSGPPYGWRSGASSVAMLRAAMEGQSGRPPR